MQGMAVSLLLLTLLQGVPQITTVEELALALQSAPEQQQASLLAQYSRLVTPALVRILIKQGDTLAARSDIDGASKTYHLAETIARQIGDTSVIGAAINSDGGLQMRQGHYQQALDRYNQAAELYRQAHDDRGLGMSLSNIAAVQRNSGDLKKALETLYHAIELLEKSGDKKSIAYARIAVAVVQSMQGNYKEAIPIYQDVLNTLQEIGDVRVTAMTLNNLGNVHRLMGNQTRAIECYMQALATKTDDKKTVAAVYNGLAALYSLQGNYDLALEYDAKSLAIKQELGNQALVNSTLLNIAQIHRLHGDHQVSLDSLQTLLDASVGDKVLTPPILGEIAEAYMAMDQPEVALSFFEKSLVSYEALGDQSGAVGLLNRMTHCLIQLGQKDKALEAAKHCVALAQEIGSFTSNWEAQTALGKAYASLNRTAEAEAAFQDAVQNVEAMRRQVAGGEEEQEQFMENKAEAYQALVDLRIQQAKTAEALETAELIKGRVLSDILQNGRNEIDKEMTPEEKERERDLREAIVALNQKILKSHSKKPDDVSELQANLKVARLQYEDFHNALFAAHPRLKIDRFESAPASISELAKTLLTADNAVLEYAVTADSIYVFVLTKEKSIQSIRLNVKPEELRDSVTEFRRKLANRDPGFHELASAMYRNLLQPIEDRLHNKKRLIIVPDSFLWELPFQALRSGSGKYLLQGFVLSYAPSLNVLYQMNRRDRPLAATSPQSLLAFGNPKPDNRQIEGAKLVYRDASLEPLPDSETEVRQVADFYQPAARKVHVQKDAREDYFKQEAPEYDVLHLATHAILNDASPLYSQLILTPGQAGEQDGLLEPWELMSMNLRAKLVILSACETARGRVSSGEGMIGLTWSFFVAGAPTTVATQWKVASSSTSELMVQFHRNLKQQHLDAATALQRAALHLLHNPAFAHPFYWAPFVLIGRS